MYKETKSHLFFKLNSTQEELQGSRIVAYVNEKVLNEKCDIKRRKTVNVIYKYIFS
jgi:hypothetical protein